MYESNCTHMNVKTSEPVKAALVGCFVWFTPFFTASTSRMKRQGLVFTGQRGTETDQTGDDPGDVT